MVRKDVHRSTVLASFVRKDHVLHHGLPTAHGRSRIDTKCAFSRTADASEAPKVYDCESTDALFFPEARWEESKEEEYGESCN